jgi:acetyl esterase/lipase
LVWLYRNAEALNVDKARIAVGGESAGGGLAASLALMARDRNEVPLAFQLLIYPMLDDRTGTIPPAEKNASTADLVWTAENNRFCWRAMLGREPGTESVSAYCAAARAPSLAGLPPARLQVGALDILADETIDYAHRLIRAGVPTELEVYPGFLHGGDLVPGTRVGARFAKDSSEALRRALSRQST